MFDALQHKYLRTMMLGLCDSEDPSVLLEAYECALLCSYCITSHRCQWLYLMVTVSVPVLGKGRSREVSCRVVGLASLSVCLGAAGHIEVEPGFRLSRVFQRFITTRVEVVD